MNDEMYMLLALRRKKDPENEGLDALCRRHIVDGTMDEAVAELKERCYQPGLWRIYRTVNKRDFTKAMKELQIEMIKDGDTFKHRISDKWKSLLMKPHNRAGKLWLVDIDTPDTEVQAAITGSVALYTVIKEAVTTKNGRHLVVEPFDKRQFEEEHSSDVVEIKKDALIYVESFNNT